MNPVEKMEVSSEFGDQELKSEVEDPELLISIFRFVYGNPYLMGVICNYLDMREKKLKHRVSKYFAKLCVDNSRSGCLPLAWEWSPSIKFNLRMFGVSRMPCNIVLKVDQPPRYRYILTGEEDALSEFIANHTEIRQVFFVHINICQHFIFSPGSHQWKHVLNVGFIECRMRLTVTHFTDKIVVWDFSVKREMTNNNAKEANLALALRRLMKDIIGSFVLDNLDARVGWIKAVVPLIDESYPELKNHLLSFLRRTDKASKKPANLTSINFSRLTRKQLAIITKYIQRFGPSQLPRSSPLPGIINAY